MSQGKNFLESPTGTMRRAFSPDSDALLELINRVQPEIPWSMARLQWQFFENPAGEARLYTIWDDNLLVALYSAIPHEISIDGEAQVAFMIQDVMTHPEYRGKGFLNYLAQCCVEDLQKHQNIAYTFPNKLSENSFRRTNWSELTRVPLRSKIIITDGECAPLTLSVTQVADFNETATVIWEKSGLVVGVCRNQSYLNWRYSRPETQYFKMMLAEDQGLVVLKLYEKEECKILHICDLLVRESAQHLIPSTLRFVEHFAREHQADRVTSWLTSQHGYAPMFNAFGLREDSGMDRFIFVRGPECLLSTVSDGALWHLSQGDSDVY